MREVVDPWVMYKKKRGLPVGILSSTGDEWKRERRVIAKVSH